MITRSMKKALQQKASSTTGSTSDSTITTTMSDGKITDENTASRDKLDSVVVSLSYDTNDDDSNSNTVTTGTTMNNDSDTVQKVTTSSKVTSKNNNKDNILTVLSLVDAYTTYHNNGIDNMKESYWNVTKAKYRTNGGLGAALLPMPTPTVGGSKNSSDTTTGSNSTGNTSTSSSSSSHGGTLILSLLNDNNDLCTRSVVQVNESKSKVSSSFYYKLVDPVLIAAEEKENNDDKNNKDSTDVIGQLVDEIDDTDTSFITKTRTFSVVDDPTTVTGLRQRGKTTAGTVTGGTTTTTTYNETNDNDNVTTKGKDIDSANNNIPNLQASLTDDLYNIVDDDTNNNDIATSKPVIVIDPFDDSNIIHVMNLHGCSNNYKNHIKLSQKYAIQSLQQYIKAATIVAAIQHEINTSIINANKE